MSQPPPADPALALYLAERDTPCPNPTCGFNLRGQSGSACPECGHELQIGLRGPGELYRVYAWVYALALSTTTILVLHTAYVIYSYIQHGFYDAGWAQNTYDALLLVLGVFSCCVLGVFLKRAKSEHPLSMRLLLVLFVGVVVADQTTQIMYYVLNMMAMLLN
ncbi:MAG: hypothetical protein IPM33_05845 [Phycisphaerales bacterium]|nr:hypothetical protein [Phycisphaerales bacterium]